jgi:GTP-dependent phosphoenolpyruvate carboxykinase
MKRYDIISQLLQDELGYKLLSHNMDKENKHRWTFVKDNKNIDLDENTILNHYIKRPSYYDKALVKAHENLLTEIEKNPLKL